MSNFESVKQIATTIRVLSAEAIDKSKSGHPGLPLGAADYAAVLFSQFLRFNPKDPHWINRDRFILSAGHGSMLLYSLLHLFGYKVTVDDLKSFRQWESKTPGHPEFGWTDGVEATTGPLGQGTANAVGVALAGKILAARYGADQFNFKTYALVSDGDLMEGISSEAGSLAGHLKLGNLVYLYDDNKISLADKTEVCFSEDMLKRFQSYGWNVESVDGHNYEQITAALDRAAKEKDAPYLISFRTTIGFGSPNKSNSSDVHGSPLGEKELALTKQNLGWVGDGFTVSDAVKKSCEAVIEKNIKLYDEWNKGFAQWKTQHGDKAKALSSQTEKAVSPELKSALIKAFDGEQKPDATRNLSGKALQVIAAHVPSFIGGSADLEPSTKTLIKETTDISSNDYSGKNIRFGVREHAMGAIANGLSYTGAFIPYTATFHVFSDYMRPTIRLAALSHLQTLFIFTHDSFWVGEDGPTHEPIEHTQSLRLIPGVNVYRPADGLEVGMCYLSALQRTKAPSVLLFTRQNLPQLKRPATFTPDDILKGGYVVSGSDKARVTLIGTGSEVSLCVSVAEMLEKDGIEARVVSLPCVEEFLRQPQAYRDSVILKGSIKVTVEAGVTVGWERFTGSEGLAIGIDHYGASAPGEVLAEKFGLTPQGVYNKVKSFIKS